MYKRLQESQLRSRPQDSCSPAAIREQPTPNPAIINCPSAQRRIHLKEKLSTMKLANLALIILIPAISLISFQVGTGYDINYIKNQSKCTSCEKSNSNCLNALRYCTGNATLDLQALTSQHTAHYAELQKSFVGRIDKLCETQDALDGAEANNSLWRIL